MKVLLIGGGGREHAIAASLVKSLRVDKLYCAPGNAGIAKIAECVNIGTMDFDKLTQFAKDNAIDLSVCSMDDPLCAGIVDAFEAKGLKIFGTRANAAIIEGSKAFSKDLMKKYGIPTAAYEIFSDADKALKYLETASYPIVLKASGLALGKGVLICSTHEEAVAGIGELMLDKKFGTAGDKIVIEEFMTGREVSVLAFVDGSHYKLMTSSQDHKRAGDGDTGLNTGGMGTFSPSPFYTPEVDAYCREHIYQKTVDAMKAEGRPFTGVLYFGLMLTPKGPRVLEYNTRFGDPETQVVLPLMKTDLLTVMRAVTEERLADCPVEFSDGAAACVIMASRGYPGAYEKGFPITIPEQLDAELFMAGVKRQDGRLVTSGGRVLGVTAVAEDLPTALKKAYAAVSQIRFENAYYRRDVGRRALEAKEA